MGSAPTIHDVAREAGVSIASVSRALSGKTKNATTIDAVRKAAASVGYHPNAVGQSLQRQRTNQIAFAVSDIANGAYIEMIRSAGAVLEEADYGLSLRSTKGDPVTEADLVANLAGRFADGMILAPLRVRQILIDALGRTQTPVVCIATLPPDAPVDSVRTDSRAGARMAVEHLIAKGCSRIAYLGGPADTGPGRSRLLGYHDALTAAGIEPDERLVEISTSFTFDGGRFATESLLARTTFDGLLAANDHLAVGAVHASFARGILVPSDLQIIGMDDSEIAGTFLPGLTSVNLRARDRGREAAELLLARLREPDRPIESTLLQPWLSVRGSTL